MIGAATLVPPKTSQPPSSRSNTHTPVLGSATAATSATLRVKQPGSACHAGFASYVLQPLPAPAHTVSVASRVPVLTDRKSVVPPTATAVGTDAGYLTANRATPLLATTATPGWS